MRNLFSWLSRQHPGVGPDGAGPQRLHTRGLTRLIATIVVVQALFWGLFYSPLLFPSSTQGMDRIPFSGVSMARLETPTQEAAATASYAPVELPHAECCDPAYLALKLGFDLDDVPSGGLGMATFQQVDNFQVLVNGSLFLARGRMEIGDQTFHGQKPYAGRIPAGLLKTGGNELIFITVRQGLPYSDLYPPILAPHDQVAAWAGPRLWQVNEYRLLAGWTTFILGLFALFLVFRAQDRRTPFWLMMLCWAWTGYAAYGLVLDPPFGGVGRLIAFFALNSLTPAAMLGFIDAWTRRPLRGLQPAICVIWIGFVILCAASVIGFPASQGYDVASAAWQVFSVVFGLAFVARLIWHFARRDEPRRLEAAILSICATCIVLDAIGEYFGLLSGGYLLEAAPVLLLALAAAFLQRNLTLFRSAIDLNNMLGDRLRAREAELADAHRRERDLVRREAHNEERRRLMRDMHDGVGSQLVSLLLTVRRGKIDAEAMSQGVQSVIDEMRLMLDSMDSVGSSLATMLAAFESRIRPRIEAAGFTLDWNTDVSDTTQRTPHDVLQVFRVMQEAVANALKHSDGDAIAITVTESPDAALDVQITDNGKGPGGARRDNRGRGVGNMQARADSIGGILTIENAAPGMCIRLTLPGSPEHTETQ